MSGWRDYNIHIGVQKEHLDIITHLFPVNIVLIADQEPAQYEEYDEPACRYWVGNDENILHLNIGPFGSDDLASRNVDYLLDNWSEILEVTDRRSELLDEGKQMVAYIWDEEGIVTEFDKRTVESRYA